MIYPHKIFKFFLFIGFGIPPNIFNNTCIYNVLKIESNYIRILFKITKKIWVAIKIYFLHLTFHLNIFVLSIMNTMLQNILLNKQTIRND
jgi:hypothetical protein